MLDLALVRSWLKNFADRHSPPIEQCILFGSAISISYPKDVDIILVSQEWYIQSLLTKIRLEFIADFKLPLHIQLFHISEVRSIDIFLKKAKIVEIVL